MSDQTNTQLFHAARTEAALRLSEATKTAILEAALDCIVTIDSRGLVLDWNPAAFRTFGYSSSEAVGREMAELIIPQRTQEMHRNGLAHAVLSGHDALRGQRVELIARRKNGEEFPVELAITRITGGPAPLFTGHIRDISARKQAEQRRAAELNVIRVLAQAASLGEAAPQVLKAVCEALQWDLGAMWRLDSAGKTLHCVHVWHSPNLPLATFVAATEGGGFAIGSGLPGRIWAKGQPEWIPDVARDPNFPRAELAAKSGLHGAFGFPLRLGKEVLGIIEFFSREIREPNPHVLEMFSAIGSQIGQFIERNEAEAAIYQMNSDLERRVAEATAELRASRERFHKAFHASPALMALLRRSDLQFLDVNAAFCRVIEFQPNEIIGHRGQTLDLWVESIQSRRLFDALLSKGTVRECELELRSRSGRIHPVLVSAEIIDVEREPHVLMVALDISARKRAERELRRALEQEKELSQLKTNFVNLVSHEFRTPLGVILSSADILTAYHDRLSQQQRADHLQDIRHATRQMGALMEEVLLLGRVDSGKMEFNPGRFDLGDFCRQVVEEQLSATRAKCSIALEIRNDSQTATGDQGLLRHIFANLLSNAIKYSPPGAEVKFSVERDEGQAVFEVRDCGLGIPAEDQTRLFEAFHRGRNVGEIPGTGLGMVIVKRCVDLHGGKIELLSELGRGTTVTIRIRLFADQVSGSTHQARKPPVRSRSKNSKRKALVKKQA